eukprot:gene4799-8385_t
MLKIFCLFFFVTCTYQQFLFGRPQNTGTPSSVVYEKIFTTLNDKDQMILLSSPKGHFGSSGTSKFGNKVTGPLYPILNEENIQEFSIRSDTNQFIIVLSEELIHKETFSKFKDIKGLLILNEFGVIPTKGYSPGSKSPNFKFGFHFKNESIEGYNWNPIGSNLNFEYFEYPVIQLSKEQSNEIKEQSILNLRNQFQFQIDLLYDYNSFKSKNSIECLEKQLCDPIGGQSVWSVLFFKENYQKKKFIISTSQSDSLSLFHSNSMNARTLSSVISNLAAADAIKRLVNPNHLEKNILFSFFTGESFGYTGSKKWLEDINQFKCKKYLKSICLDPFIYSMEFKNILDIEHVIEIGQIGENNNTLFFHSIDDKLNDKSKNKPSPKNKPTLNNKPNDEHFKSSNITYLFNIFKNVSTLLDNGIKIKQSKLSNIIPPGSLNSFLFHDKSGIILNEFDDEFKNKYYQSKFDNIENINLNQICKISSLLATSLFEISKYKNINSMKIESNCTLIKELSNTLLKQSSYSGVFRFYNNINENQYFIFEFMSKLTQLDNSSLKYCETHPLDVKYCNENETCISNKCIKISTYYHHSYSKDLEFKDKKWIVLNESNYDSIFTESIWLNRGSRIYLKEGIFSQIFSLFFGCFIVMITFFLFLSQNFYKRFQKQIDLNDNTDSIHSQRSLIEEEEE